MNNILTLTLKFFSNENHIIESACDNQSVNTHPIRIFIIEPYQISVLLEFYHLKTRYFFIYVKISRILDTLLVIKIINSQNNFPTVLQGDKYYQFITRLIILNTNVPHIVGIQIELPQVGFILISEEIQGVWKRA